MISLYNICLCILIKIYKSVMHGHKLLCYLYDSLQCCTMLSSIFWRQWTHPGVFKKWGCGAGHTYFWSFVRFILQWQSNTSVKETFGVNYAISSNKWKICTLYGISFMTSGINKFDYILTYIIVCFVLRQILIGEVSSLISKGLRVALMCYRLYKESVFLILILPTNTQHQCISMIFLVYMYKSHQNFVIQFLTLYPHRYIFLASLFGVFIFFQPF